jgi:ATP-binding cassette, subfamily B, bacterial PglK
VQRSFLLQPYSFHIARNTSTLITNALDKVEALVFEVLIPSMQAATAGFIALFIIAALVSVDPMTAIIAAIAFCLIYAAVSVFSRSRIAANSDIISRGFDERMRITQEGLGGIRDVIIDGTHSLYLAQFERVNSKFNKARANTLIIASTPRFIIETIGIVAIAGIAFVASQRAGGFAAALPVLGAIALGAQRLLPLIQQVYSGWSTASGYLPVVGETIDLLRLPADESEFKSGLIKPLTFTDRISVQHVSFTYPSRRSPTLSDVSLEIPHGSTTALMGSTGSGKSTLVDLIMGLLPPDEGSISIDGTTLTDRNRRRWQRCIAHVPQSIFLADATIARNIALGMGDKAVDEARIVEASKKAQLHEFVCSLADGYDTFVGERGIRLSGGQRQRLGLARAIYKDAPLLVLDEATSALDEVTEAAVFEALEQLRTDGRTIIVIAHRHSTTARCDHVVRLNEGRIVDASPAKGALRPAQRFEARS